MAWLILLGLIGLPVIEIALFVSVAESIGWLATIALVIGSAMAGLALVRVNGVITAFRVQNQLQKGEMPVAEMFDGLCLSIAGGLLLLPGFASDGIALLLLAPPIRHALRKWLAARLPISNPAGAGPHDGPGSGPTVIDGEYKVVEDPPDRHPG